MNYPPELRRMAELTAGAIDNYRIEVIANVLEGDLKRAYDLGYKDGVKQKDR